MELLRGRFRLEKNHLTVWVLIGLCVIASILLIPIHLALSYLASGAVYWLIIQHTKGWRKLLLFIAVLLLVSGSRYYYSAADRICASASPTPLAAVAPVNASVIPGGDPLEICINGEHLCIRVCYFLGNGVAVAAAHRSEINLGEYPIARDGEHLPGSVTVIEDTDFGLVVTGHPPIPLHRPALPLANTDEIAVGRTAEALMGDEPPITVEVKGYTERSGSQQLVLQPTARDPRFGPGCSGAPVVQDGKIIGFIAGGAALSKTPIGYAKLAADVYLGVGRE